MALTGGEYDLLLALVERANRVLTRDMLLDLLRGRQAGPFDRAIDVAVSRLRRKLEDDGRRAQLIKTVRGGGYVLAATVERAVRLRLWPRSLAARTAVVLLFGLAVVQAAGLTIHALDRLELQRLAQAREIAARVMSVYRNVANVDAGQRAATLADMRRLPGMAIGLSDQPPISDLPPTPPGEQRLLRVNMNLAPMPGHLRPHDIQMLGGPFWHRLLVSLRLPEGGWLNLTLKVEPPRPWHSPTFLIAFLLMTAAAALLTLWAVRRLTAPVRTLAARRRGAGPRRQRPAAARGRAARGRRRRRRVQHHGGAHPPLRAATAPNC